MPCRANVSMALLDRLRKAGMLDRAREKKIAAQYFAQLRVKASSMEVPVSSLSGGNQQKKESVLRLMAGVTAATW